MIKVFISYAHADESYKEELEKRLALLKHNGTIESWNGKEILPEIEWDKEIKRQIQESQMILLLISNDFLVSDYINDIEIKLALDRYRKGEVIIVPIIIRPNAFSDFEIGKFQVLPKDGRPVSTWENQDEAWEDIISHLNRVFKSFNEGNIPLKHSSEKNGTNLPLKQNPRHSKSEILELITKGDTEKALDLLISVSRSISNRDLLNYTMLLTSRFKGLQQNNTMGVISSADASISHAQINKSLRSLVEDYDFH